MSVKIYVKEVKSEIRSISYIFLYTKIIYQSLAVERIVLNGKSQLQNPKDERRDGF